MSQAQIWKPSPFEMASESLRLINSAIDCIYAKVAHFFKVNYLAGDKCNRGEVRNLVALLLTHDDITDAGDAELKSEWLLSLSEAQRAAVSETSLCAMPKIATQGDLTEWRLTGGDHSFDQVDLLPIEPQHGPVMLRIDARLRGVRTARMQTMIWDDQQSSHLLLEVLDTGRQIILGAMTPQRSLNELLPQGSVRRTLDASVTGMSCASSAGGEGDEDEETGPSVESIRVIKCCCITSTRSNDVNALNLLSRVPEDGEAFGVTLVAALKLVGVEEECHVGFELGVQMSNDDARGIVQSVAMRIAKSRNARESPLWVLSRYRLAGQKTTHDTHQRNPFYEADQHQGDFKRLLKKHRAQCFLPSDIATGLDHLRVFEDVLGDLTTATGLHAVDIYSMVINHTNGVNGLQSFGNIQAFAFSILGQRLPGMRRIVLKEARDWFRLHRHFGVAPDRHGADDLSVEEQHRWWGVSQEQIDARRASWDEVTQNRKNSPAKVDSLAEETARQGAWEPSVDGIAAHKARDILAKLCSVTPHEVERLIVDGYMVNMPPQIDVAGSGSFELVKNKDPMTYFVTGLFLIYARRATPYTSSEDAMALNDKAMLRSYLAEATRPSAAKTKVTWRRQRDRDNGAMALNSVAQRFSIGQDDWLEWRKGLSFGDVRSSGISDELRAAGAQALELAFPMVHYNRLNWRDKVISLVERLASDRVREDLGLVTTGDAYWSENELMTLAMVTFLLGLRPRDPNKPLQVYKKGSYSVIYQSLPHRQAAAVNEAILAKWQDINVYYELIVEKVQTHGLGALAPHLSQDQLDQARNIGIGELDEEEEP